MTKSEVQADEVYAFLTDALKSGTSPEVLEAALEAAIRFAIQQVKSGLWPDAVSLQKLKAAEKEWWMS